MSAQAHTGGPEAAELNCFIISERSRKNISLLPNNRLWLRTQQVKATENGLMAY